MSDDLDERAKTVADAWPDAALIATALREERRRVWAQVLERIKLNEDYEEFLAWVIEEEGKS